MLMRKIIRKTLLLVNIFLAASLLVSYLAVHISPEDFILPAFFGLLYPYMLVLNIVIAVIWAVNLKLYALISVTVILIGFNHLGDFIRTSKKQTDNSAQFTIMSYNVRLFNYYEGPGSSTTEKEITSLIGEVKPGILCLQEYFVTGEAEKMNQTIADAIGSGIDSHIKLTGRGSSRHYGIATFSRFPVVNRGEIIHPNSSSLSIYTDILINADTVRIFNNHLQSFRLRRMERSFVGELIGRQDQSLTELKSVSAGLREGFVRRAMQAKVLRAFIESSPYPVIVTGDFNDTPVSYSYRKIRKGLADSFVKRGYGAGFTYKGKYPSNRIDYILHDMKFIPVYFNVMKVKYSDHYPVMAGFNINN
jgi:endonuclease/exonuclease/phosphatase family metal-dependent hydrolase